MATSSVHATRDVKMTSASQRKRKTVQALIGYSFLLPTFLFILSFSYYPAVRALIGASPHGTGSTLPLGSDSAIRSSPVNV